MGTVFDNRRCNCTGPNSSATGTVISGSDLGFRVERPRGSRMTGTLVVRINGEWLVAEPAEGVKALTGK